MEVQQAQLTEQVGGPQGLHAGEQIRHREPKLGPLPHRAAPAAGAAGGELGANADEGGRPQLVAGGDDPLHLIGLLDHHHRLAAEAAGQDCRFDVAAVLIAVADQQGLGIVKQRQGDQQFGLAAGLQAEVPATAALHQLLHHVALLVAFHRKNALIAASVGVLSDGPLEGGMQPLQPVLKDVVEADQQGQAQVAALELPHQLHQIQRSAPLAAGLHDHVAPFAHGEVGIAPAVDAVEGGTVGGAPGAGGIGEHHRAPGCGGLRGWNLVRGVGGAWAMAPTGPILLIPPQWGADAVEPLPRSLVTITVKGVLVERVAPPCTSSP